MNKVFLTGRLVDEPQLVDNGQYTRSTFVLAVDRRRMNASSDAAMFINCVTFSSVTATFLRNYVHKGFLISVEGRLDVSRSRNNDTGENRTFTSVVVENIEILSKPNSFKTNHVNETKTDVNELFPETGVTTNFEKPTQKIEPLENIKPANNTNSEEDNSELDWYIKIKTDENNNK
ncbi:MAG: single-stranded DNA-binding protein [Mycoplasma sp.]